MLMAVDSVVDLAVAEIVVVDAVAAAVARPGGRRPPYGAALPLSGQVPSTNTKITTYVSGTRHLCLNRYFAKRNLVKN